MIEIKKYRNIEEALEKIMGEDIEHIIVWHKLEKGYVVNPHVHDVDEWVVFNRGECVVSLGSEYMPIKSEGETKSIYFPKKEYHGLTCLTDIFYVVIREPKE